MTHRTTILVDMDGVLAHFNDGFEARWNQHPTAVENEWFPVYLADAATMKMPPQLESRWGIEAADLFRDITNSGDFYRGLDPIPGAIDGINRLFNLGYNVFICTAPSRWVPTCASEKIAWANHYLGELWGERTIIARDKTLVRGDYLIDDKPNVTGSLEPVWKHIVYAAPYNDSADTWETIAQRFDGSDIYSED